MLKTFLENFRIKLIILGENSFWELTFFNPIPYESKYEHWTYQYEHIILQDWG